jgi:preprotein translocase subunit SecG
MQTILLVVQVMLAIALIAIILVQRSDNDGFGMGSGGGGTGMLSGRAKSNFMTRTTAILAAAFMLNSLILTMIVAGTSPTSIVDRIEKIPATDEQAEESIPAETAPFTVPRADDASTVQERQPLTPDISPENDATMTTPEPAAEDNMEVPPADKQSGTQNQPLSVPRAE